MTAPVPEQRIVLNDEGVRIGNSVRAVHWVHPARLQNWVAGRGRMLVPNHSPLVTIQAGAQSDFRWRVRPSYPHTRLRYHALLSAETEAISAIAIPVGGSQRGGTFVVHNRRRMNVWSWDVDLGSQSDVEQEISMTIAASGQPLVVEGLAVEALPRAFLTAASPNDLGANRLAFWHRNPISERNFYQHIFQLQSGLKRSARRALFQFAWGDDDPWTTAIAGPTAIFDDKILLNGRNLYNGDTTRGCVWRVLARCSDGTTAGTVALTNTGAGSANTTIAIPAGTTTATWLPVTTGDPDSFDCDAEDPTDSWGLRASAVDEHTITVERTAGTGTIYIESISIWEPPDAAPPAPTSRRVTDAGDPRITDAGDQRIID